MSAPYEIEVVLTDDPTAPTRRACITRTTHGARVQRTVIDRANIREIDQPDAAFDDYERALACVNRWLHGQEWAW